jgi:type II secretory pathway pseudopilin PulG
MDAFRRGRRKVRRSCDERGIAMLATLVTIIILGVMVVIMFNTLSGSPSGTGTTIPGATTVPGLTTTTAPSTPANGAQEAVVSACEANYQDIETALADYRSLNGSLPAAGTAWVTSTANGGPYLQSWPQSALYYSISWNGAQLSVIPVRGAASHGSDGTRSPKSGCFAG